MSRRIPWTSRVAIAISQTELLYSYARLFEFTSSLTPCCLTSSNSTVSLTGLLLRLAVPKLLFPLLYPSSARPSPTNEMDPLVRCTYVVGDKNLSSGWAALILSPGCFWPQTDHRTLTPWLAASFFGISEPWSYKRATPAVRVSEGFFAQSCVWDVM